MWVQKDMVDHVLFHLLFCMGITICIKVVLIVFNTPGGDHSTKCILIVESKHRNIQIVICTPKILCTVLKKQNERPEIDLQLHKR